MIEIKDKKDRDKKLILCLIGLIVSVCLQIIIFSNADKIEQLVFANFNELMGIVLILGMPLIWVIFGLPMLFIFFLLDVLMPDKEKIYEENMKKNA